VISNGASSLPPSSPLVLAVAPYNSTEYSSVEYISKYFVLRKVQYSRLWALK